jgi:hypothetical protein
MGTKKQKQFFGHFLQRLSTFLVTSERIGALLAQQFGKIRYCYMKCNAGYAMAHTLIVWCEG